MEPSEIKTKCQAVMLAHLKTKGYPDMSRREILDELKPMWLKLEEAGLTDEIKKLGGTFLNFKDVAVKKAQEAAIFEHLGGFVRANPRRVK